jgi:hypothetical protein
MRHRRQRLRLDREPLRSDGAVGQLGATAAPRRNSVSTPIHPLATSLLELQRLAGNRAVAAEIGSWRNGRVVIGVSNVDLKAHPSQPPNGVREIRESRGGGGLLGRTVASIDPAPPLLRADTPAKVDSGWTCQAIPARAPEPYLEEWWPTAGRHEMYPHVYLDVSKEWEERLKAGEDEHVGDHTLGWQLTWGTVSEAIADLARVPGPVQPTEEAARTDLWKRFSAALPPDLRPQGNAPTDDAQTAQWGFAPSTSLFRRLFLGTKARDQRGWHTTTSELGRQEGQDGKDEIRHVAGDTRIGEVSSEDLIGEIRRAATGTR